MMARSFLLLIKPQRNVHRELPQVTKRKAHPLREFAVDEFAEVVDEEEVSFLAGGSAFAGDHEIAGGESLSFAATATEERDTGKPHRLGFL